jgi:hypothetical protein
MKNNKYVLSSLIFLFTGVFYFTMQAQQKNDTHRANFSGEWKSKEPISIGGNIFCSYVEGDRMNSKAMKIVEDADFLTIENPNQDPGATSTRSHEKLLFNGKESQLDNGKGNEKKFTVKFSADGQTMTIKSIVYFMDAAPYNIDVSKKAFKNVTEIESSRKAFTNVIEVWKLSNDGKSIVVQSNAKSNIWGGERNWNTVFYKTN